MRLARAPWLFVLLALAPAVRARAGEDLATARDRFGSSGEREYNEGVEICVRLNDVPAVELMLEVLRTWDDRGGGFLPQPHYRDIVWGGLNRITDPYARKRVETELATAKSAWVRQWCAETLGEYRDSAYGEKLVKALRDDELGVRRAAARALGKIPYGPGVKALLSLDGDKDEILRANAIEALARIDATAHAASLLKGLKDKDGGVRCALLATAHECLADRSETLSAEALKDPDWRPRMQAVDNLGTIRTKGSVDALVLALADGRPAVAARAVRRLQELTGQKHARKEAWEAWWRDARETFAFPDGPSKAESAATGSVAYHGVPLTSDHAAFLIDKSDEMRHSLKSKSTTKAEAALAELDAVLGKLQGRLTFNVFCYAEYVEALKKFPLELTPGAHKKALAFVAECREGNQKNIWQVLETVVSDPDLDTAFLLSSGEPDIGTYVHWNRVTWQLAELNRFHKVVVHTVVYSDNKWFRDQLEKIAEVTGGEFRWFE